jgi:outer membrane protein TolC
MGCAQLPTDVALPTPTKASWQQELAQLQVEPIVGTLTLNEAIARGLKYNLDRRAKQLEMEIASGQYESALQEMLPRARAQIDRNNRSQELLRRNSNGTPSNATTDRNHTVQDLGVSWSLLEFGVGYYNSKQARERVHIANERRRKLIHTLIQDVSSAYWRAACAQAMRVDL